jgi:hypothetical protein
VLVSTTKATVHCRTVVGKSGKAVRSHLCALPLRAHNLVWFVQSHCMCECLHVHVSPVPAP